MSSKSRNRLKLAALTGMAGLMATSAGAATLKSSTDCPDEASAVGSLRTIVGANTDYNSAPARKKAAKKKAAKRAHKVRTKKKAAKVKTKSRIVKKAAKKKAAKKARKKIAKRTLGQPC